jgi:DNA-binding beta-propeller fold protein YncE
MEAGSMNDGWVRPALESIIDREPPLGSVVHDALRAGVKLRRRRRAQGVAGSAAVVAVAAVVVAIPKIAPGNSAAVSGAAAGPAIAYVVNIGGETITPISIGNGTPGRAIRLGNSPVSMTITPDGKTVYVPCILNGAVVPVTTATNKPGRPIKVGGSPQSVVITPDGKTAYVVVWGEPGTVTPIATATNTAGTPIEVGDGPYAIAITPGASHL